MAKHAFIVGGTGQIGRALATRLLNGGWEVTTAHRGKRGVPPGLRQSGARHVVLDRDQPGALAAALQGGVDALIDTVAFDESHADQLLAVQGRVGAFAVMSSVSVYCDDQGRTLDEADVTGFPMMPNPILETNRTTPPGPQTYSTRKAALEQGLLGGATRPVTILRPGAIYGPGALNPREWWFVKRILDGRRRIPLAFNGESLFSATSVANLAAITQAALENPGTRILNAVDPETISVFDRGAAIAGYMAADCELVRLGPQPEKPYAGMTPWSAHTPFAAADTAARGIGYVPVEGYAQGIQPMVDWLVTTQAAGDWREHFPGIANGGLFDYAAEDETLRSAGR